METEARATRAVRDRVRMERGSIHISPYWTYRMRCPWTVRATLETNRATAIT